MVNNSFSIIIPLHNGAQWIRATLASMRAQTVEPAEVIVVDDGSTDGGGEIARNFVFKDGSSPIVIRHEAPLGVAVARNHGALVANGNWLGFCDHDDVWHPRRIELILETAVEHPEHLAVASEVLGFALDTDRPHLEGHPRGAMVNEWVANDHVETLAALSTGCSVGVRELRFEDFQQDTCVPTALICFRRDLFAMAGGYPIWNNATGDWLLHASTAALCPILVIGQPLVYYRVRPMSQSHSDVPQSAGALAVLLALRFGDRPDRRPVGPIYRHMLWEGARSRFRLSETLGFALLGRLGWREIAGLLKASVGRRRVRELA